MEFIAVKRYLSEVRVAEDFACLSHPAPLLPVVSWAQKDVRFSDVNDHTVKAGFRDSDAKYGSGFTLYFDVKPALFKFIVSSEFRVPPAARRHVALMLMRFNWAQQEGCAEIDLRDGELRFRCGFPLLGASTEHVRNITQVCIDRAACWTALANTVHDLSALLMQQEHPTLDDDLLTAFVAAAGGEDTE